MITGLVLQGGGALGAFELGVIEWLLDNQITPDVVSGVSIGAINATVLAGSKQADPREELRGPVDRPDHADVAAAVRRREREGVAVRQSGNVRPARRRT